MRRQEVNVIELVRDYLSWLLQRVVHWVCLLGEAVGALPTDKEFAVGTREEQKHVVPQLEFPWLGSYRCAAVWSGPPACAPL